MPRTAESAPPAAPVRAPAPRRRRAGKSARLFTRRYTADEFFRLPLAEEDKWELVKGELRLSPSPNFPHQQIFLELGFLLKLWLRRNPIAVIVPDWDVKFLLDETRRPDLVVALKQESRLTLGAHGEGAPDLVVEILSPGQAHRDLGDKKELYERCGVREYWVVDYQKRRIHQFLPGADGRYTETLVTQGALKSRVLAGFRLGLKPLFSVLDE